MKLGHKASNRVTDPSGRAWYGGCGCADCRLARRASIKGYAATAPSVRRVPAAGEPRGPQ